MNKHFLAASLIAVSLTGCGSFGGSSTSITPISEQRAVSNFTREGVKITYTFSGNVDSIEATGYAPIWGNSENAIRESFRVAELEAKKSLNDFINKETVRSSVSVKMISANIESAEDNRNTGNATVVSDSDVETQDTSPANNQVRQDSLKIASKVSTFISTQNRGILGGLTLVQGEVINGGKNVKVVYRWDKKSQASRLELRSALSR